MTRQTDELTSTSGVSRAGVRLLCAVFLAGAVGGILYWILAKWTGTTLPTTFGPATIPVLMFIGALAAAFGVYLLTASDLNAIRTYIFAVVCGLAWQPMIASATRLATNAVASGQTAQVGANITQIKSATSGGNLQQINSAVENTASAVNGALGLSTSVTDASKKTEIADTSKQAITELQVTAVRAPDASLNALKSISLAAAKSGESSVALRAVETLHSIGSEAVSRNNTELLVKVVQSLNEVAAQSNDPSIQSAAKNAGLQLSR